MTTQLISDFNEAGRYLSESQANYDNAVTAQASFTENAYKRYLSHPSALTGYHEQTSPVSSLGRNFADGISQGWTLKAIRPATQFAVVLVWQTADMTKKSHEARCKEMAHADWERHIKPFAIELQFAQHEYDRYAAEVAALKEALSQVN